MKTLEVPRARRGTPTKPRRQSAAAGSTRSPTAKSSGVSGGRPSRRRHCAFSSTDESSSTVTVTVQHGSTSSSPNFQDAAGGAVGGLNCSDAGHGVSVTSHRAAADARSTTRLASRTRRRTSAARWCSSTWPTRRPRGAPSERFSRSRRFPRLPSRLW